MEGRGLYALTEVGGMGSFILRIPRAGLEALWNVGAVYQVLRCNIISILSLSIPLRDEAEQLLPYKTVE